MKKLYNINIMLIFCDYFYTYTNTVYSEWMLFEIAYIVLFYLYTLYKYMYIENLIIIIGYKKKFDKT